MPVTKKLKDFTHEWYMDNRHKLKDKIFKKKLGRKKDPNKRRKEWIKNNPEKYESWEENYRPRKLAHNRNRYAAKLNRTPKWADLKAIEEFYINCPNGYHVDHIIPLQGKIVSGLHTLENLQYLPAIENLKKNNKFK